MLTRSPLRSVIALAPGTSSVVAMADNGIAGQTCHDAARRVACPLQLCKIRADQA